MSNRKTIYSIVVKSFEHDEPRKLDEIYRIVIENGIEDKKEITRHTIRGIIHKLHKTGRIKRLAVGTYQKTPDT